MNRTVKIIQLTAFFAKNNAGTLYFSNISSAALIQKEKNYKKENLKIELLNQTLLPNMK